jgi:hypothetical protein
VSQCKAGVATSHLTNTDCREKDLGRLTKENEMAAPFSRSLAIFAAIQMALSAPKWQMQSLMAAIPEYKSRGKGLGKPGKNFFKKAGKYMPHQGKQECARRVRQMNSL